MRTITQLILIVLLLSTTLYATNQFNYPNTPHHRQAEEAMARIADSLQLKGKTHKEIADYVITNMTE